MTNEYILQLNEGNVWRTMGYLPMNTYLASLSMNQLKRQYPNNRVRVIDGAGRLVDMMV